MTYYGDVGAFHEKFALPKEGDRQPEGLSVDLLRFRGAFLIEELIEFFQAYSGTHEVLIALGSARQKLELAAGRTVNGKDAAPECDLEKAADALADLVYVALGTAHMMGLPFDAIWAEVQRANMTKERAESARDERSKRQHVFDVVKPAGWTPPDHGPALRKAADDAAR